MQLRYSYRLYPDPAQRAALARAFGCARVVFNDALAARQAAHEAGEPYISDTEMSRRLTAAKGTPKRAWLGDVSSVVLQQALADLNRAYRNFFDSVTGKRRGPRAGQPRFRSRKDPRQSVRFTANSRFKVLDNGKLRLPKVGDVSIRWSRALPAAPASVTVIRDAAGRFFASFVVEVTPEQLPGTAFVAMLEYKARLYGRDFRKIGRFEPTSQVCSACGVQDGPKPLSVREWTCPACRTALDRDVNAAKNILALGRRERLNARGGQVRPLATAAQADEPGSRRGAA